MKAHSIDEFWVALRIFGVLLLSIMVSSCASTSYKSKSTEYSDATPVTAIYLYSFLDLREKTLGPKFLDEVKRQLPAVLSQEKIAISQLWFNESPLSAQFSLEAVSTNPGNSKTHVPVDEVISANQKNERSSGASHRLIAFPSYVATTNYASSFSIRWTLINSQTNQLSWTTTSSSYHQKWFFSDENPQDRAKAFVDGLIIELRKAKIVRDQHNQI